MHRIKLLFFTLAFSPCTLPAQRDVVTSGGNASSATGSISYSIGQVVYSNESSATGSINQGVQQPYEITPISVNESWREIAVELYPNPTRNNLLVRMPEYIPGLTLQIFTLNGALMEERPILSQQTTLNAEQWAASTYIVKLSDKDGNFSEYKLIKQ
jgi:hypothetical protein